MPEQPKRPLDETALLAMPADEYLNDEQSPPFRARLLALRRELRENSKQRVPNCARPSPPDEADRATQGGTVLETADRDRELSCCTGRSALRDRRRTYGYCEATGEPIGVGRLLARPTATLSLEEQERHEREERFYR